MAKMHSQELDITPRLVEQLIANQFPEWSELSLVTFTSAGTDHAIYKLGETMVIRLPRIPDAAAQVEKEQLWLPQLAPSLPLSIPRPIAMGIPGQGYPWHWSVYEWLPGERAAIDLSNVHGAASSLAYFVNSLGAIESVGGPLPGTHNSFRGGSLSHRDVATRKGIDALADTFDARKLTRAWDRALQAPLWQGAPRWIHGDLHSANMLVSNGKLSAVIDFGCLGIGDQACDVMAGWTVFNKDARKTFRGALHIDDATWERGRGWALSFGLVALPYYRYSNPDMANLAAHAIAEALKAE
jgi:aminoglycoside phosphotransferase (APT) family kinase protein